MRTKWLVPVLVSVGALAACEAEDLPADLFLPPPVVPALDGGISPIDAGPPGTDGGDLDAGPEPDAGPAIEPNTTIDAKPGEKTKETTASIAFSSDTAGVTFVCSLDGAAFAPCTSPFEANVTSGPHTFSVAAVSGELQDPTPATCTWTVDTTPPDTTITAGPSGGVPNGDATFAFTSAEPGSTFECALDGAAFTACTSEHVMSGLAVGSHTFSVRATDEAGNVDPSPATRTWTVERQDTEGPPVTVTITPLVGGRTRGNGQVAYSSTVQGVTFACRTYLQGTTPPALGPCGASPFTLSGFTHGNNVVIDVEGRDAQNDPTLVSRTVTIDAEGPTITITAPGGRINRAGTLTFTAAGDGSETYACAVLDPGGATIATGACTPAAGLAFPIGGSGTYTARVTGTDALGNATTVNQVFTVDVTGPAVTVSSCAQARVNDPITCTVGSGAADIARFECLVDGLTRFAACSNVDLSTATIPGAAVGTNTVQIRGVDDLGNAGAPVSTTVDGVRYSAGHAVLIGHDYLESNADTRALLVNAFHLSYPKVLGLPRNIKVLMWCSTTGCDSPEEENVVLVANAAGIEAADIQTFHDPRVDLGRALTGRDVFLVVDQNGRDGLDGTGKSWTDAMHTNFAARGGTVIVLDGLDGTGKNPSQTFQVLVGSGLLGARPGGGQEGSRIVYGQTDPELQAGVSNGYTGPKNTVTFLAPDAAWTSSFQYNADQPVVLHRQFVLRR